jgi:methylenetetrahydrofolate dehydrogenase (NADP+)/methenyltetrahydrofolate cyclohydrolase
VTAELIDGREIAAEVRREIATRTATAVDRGEAPPGLATVLVGSDPASAVYVGSKQRACAEVGFQAFDHRLPADSTEEVVGELIDELNADPAVSGILLQLPLPAGLDAAPLIEGIDPLKDVDGLTVSSVGLLGSQRPGLRPCTPLGVMELLDRSGVPVSGADAVVVGRSALVGRPLAQLLIEADATVTVCHSRTRDLAERCAEAEIVICAVGAPDTIRGEWIRPGATVIDVGINRVGDHLVGDVDFEGARQRAGLITPVPGGVGPMTIAMLLRNTFTAAEMQSRRRRECPV